jgi:hypothetical protein
MVLVKGGINDTTGFRNPTYVYSDFVGSKEPAISLGDNYGYSRAKKNIRFISKNGF